MNMRPLFLMAPLALLSGCVAPTGPVEVTRFHVPDVAPLARGTIAVEAAAGMDPASLELRAYEDAVAQELRRLGYTVNESGGDQVALVRLSRQSYLPSRTRSPVTVGGNGTVGSYGSGVGLGIGIDLSGPPSQQTETALSVMIRDRKSAKALWEGAARFTVKASSPLAQTSLGAPKLAEALFRGFPGQSGETILVK